MIIVMKKMKVIFVILTYSFLIGNCFSQSKQAIVFPADSMNFKIYQETVKKYQLQDLKSSKDNIYIRFLLKVNPCKIFAIELKKNNDSWKSRLIYIGIEEVPYFMLEYTLFNRYHLIESRKSRKMLRKAQVSIDFSPFYESYNSDIKENFIVAGNIDQRIINLESQIEVDTSTQIKENSVILEIELSTSNEYKYLHWIVLDKGNSYSSKIINRIYASIFENRHIIKRKFDWKKYRKNHWS